MSNLTWLGDSDPEAVAVTMYGVTFVKGESTPVKDKDAFENLKGNPMFSAEKSVEPTPADEPDEDERLARSEEGTEKAALKAQLKALGVDMGKGNPSVETLRNKLVEATR